MKPVTRWILIAVAGVVLLLLPTVTRDLRRPNVLPLPAATSKAYVPPDVPTPQLAVTPIPTATPVRIDAAAHLPTADLPRGPIVVDLAHYSRIDRARFQPLAAALAQYGLDLRFWLPTVDTSKVKAITDFPDMSADLAKQLSGASGLVVASPLFLYTPAEIAEVERFVADGGRLLLISDPDIESDSASDTNQLAAAFNVVFNQDYLYDTTANDENFTYFFQDEFLGNAADLAGSRIAFYGGRSIGGAVETLVRSASTTLSSLRNGLTAFNTVVLGGSPANNSTGRVLAMSDFDVLTDPYVARHDNRRMLQFVASFLADAKRNSDIADFPAFLGKQVALALESSEPVGALSLSTAAELQRVLEASGRELLLGATGTYTQTAAGASPDLIYVASYRTADSETDILHELGIQLVEEIITPTVTAPTPVNPTQVPPATPLPESGAPDGSEQLPSKETPPPPSLPQPEVPSVTPAAPPELPPLMTPSASPTAQAAGQSTPPSSPVTTPPTTPEPTSATPDTVARFDLQQAQITATVTATETNTVTSTVTNTDMVDPSLTFPTPEVTPATPAAAATPDVTTVPEPQVRLLLDRSDGLRLLADETLLFVRRTHSEGTHTLAVLGNSAPAINAAMTRLLNRDFSGCLAQADLVICPYSPGTAIASPTGAAGAAPAGDTASALSTPEATRDASSSPTPGAPAAPQPPGAASILVVDNNADADPSEPSEAAIYLLALTQAGYQVDNWVTGDKGLPEGKDLFPYAWVIWSDASYKSSGIDGESLRVAGEYINQGGRLTISSRMPFFGMSAKPASVIKDIVVADEIPELVKGLPTTPIVLNNDSPALTPLEKNPDPSAGARAAMARGPASGETGAPVLILLSDAGFEEPKGALLMLFGVSMGWLPPDVSDQLIRNMADVMLAQ